MMVHRDTEIREDKICYTVNSENIANGVTPVELSDFAIS